MFKKTYLFLTLLTALLLGGTGIAWGEETLPLGSNTSALVGCPVYATWADQMYCSQTVYPASSLTAMTGKSITHLTYFLRALNPNGDYSSVQIRLLEVDYDVLATSTGSKSFKSIEGATLVFEGTLPASTTTELEVEFSEPFAYGGGNLLVDVRKTVTGGAKAPSSSSGGKGRFKGTSVSTYVGLYNYGNGSFPTTGTPLTYYPDITFTYEDGTPIKCPKPSALTQGEVSHNSAAFTWTAGGSETTWQYVYLPAATTLTDEAWSGATAGSVNTAAVTLSNLSPATDYKLYVRAYCSSTDQSKNISKAFRTNNAVPFSEDFTGLTSGNIPTGWDNSEGTTTTASSKWVYYNSGHDAAPCVRFNSYSNSKYNTNILKTPAIYVDKAAALSFWYKNPTGGDFSVYYSIDGVKQADALATGLTGAADWTNFEVALPAACVGHNVQILFQGTSNYGSGDAYIYLDEVVIEAASSCVKPTALNAYATSATTANVSWTAGGEETAWNLQFSTDNFETYTERNGITENPYTLTGLSAQTTYKVRIQADCGGAQSGWVASSAFPTPCEAVNGIGWSENFEDATAGSGKMPDCWQKNTANNSYPQVSSSYYFQKTGSMKCLYFDGGASGSERIAILPPFSEATSTFYVTLDYSQAYENYGYLYDYSGEDYGQLAIGYMTNPADASTFTAKETLPRVNAYTTASVALTGAPANAYVALRYAGGDYSGYLFVDNISISAIPSCVAPSNVNGAATAYNQASIAWTVNGTEEAWKLQYKATDAENWSAEIDANTNPFTLTGLSANTDYIVQVKALCGGEDVSSWSGSSAPFSTPCQPVDASDYSENMESSAINVGHLPDCWQYREKYGSGIPYVYNGSYYAYAGSQCLYFQGGVDESSEQSVLLPEMDQPLNDLTLEFYYKAAESGWYTYAKFTVGYIAADGTTFVPVETLDYANNYTKYTKDLAALPADAKCIAIRFAGGESSAYGYIDNVRVYPTPTCAAPTGVTVSNVTATTADVAWTENNSATAWKIQLSNDGSTWGDAISVSANPYTLENLTPNHTTYYVRVKTVCGENDESPYSEASAPFYTECGSVALPFNDDFSGNIDCWSTPSCYSSTGLYNGAFRFYYNGYGQNPPQYLISPEIDTDNKEVTVEFDYYAYSSGYPESFEVGYSKTNNEEASFTWGASVTAENTSALKYSANLPAGVKYIAIKHTSDDQYYLYIDNFSVTEYVAPACPAVTASTIEANAQAHTATITWDAAGEETAWNLQYKAAGGEWSDVIAISTTPSYDMSGLAENTLYYVRVQADCDGDGTGDWTGDEAFSFRTDCDPKAVSKASPWSYDFEDTNDGFMPSCWERTEPYANYGYPVVAEYSYYAQSGDKYLYLRTPGRSGSSYTEDAILPVFNTEIKNLKVSFSYFNGAATSNYGQLAIGYVVGDEFTQVGELLAQVEDYTLVEREMPNDAPNSARIAVRCIGSTKGSSYTTTVYLDDIQVSLKPTCYVPTALAATETSDGAVLTWTAGKDENEWSVRYSVIDADTWTTINEIATNSYTITGLSQNVTYEVQVKAVCGVGEESDWSASVEFSPACNAPSALAVTACTGNSATFSWTSNESAFVLQYSADGETWLNENVAANPFTLEGLTAATTYQAKIQAACGSDFSNVVEFTTWCGLANANELPLNEDFSAGAKPDCWQFISATEYPTIASEKLWFQGNNEQIAVLPGFNINLSQLHVSFDYTTANGANIELGYYAANGGNFVSLGAVTSGEDVDLSTKSAPAEAGYLAIRYYGATETWATGSVDNVHVTRQLVLADNDVNNSAILDANNGKIVDVVIGRTFTRNYGEDTNPDHYNTICLPFSLSAEELAASPIASNDLWAFKYAKVDEATNELQFRIVEADHIEAGKPYFIGFPANEENIVNPLFKNVTITASAGQNVGDDVAQLCGILKPETFTAGDPTKLFLYTQTNTLYWWNGSADSQLNGFRAFFYVPGNSDSNGAPIRFNMSARIVKEEQTATGIENTTLNENGTMKVLENNQVVIIRNGVKYTLQGQKIQ